MTLHDSEPFPLFVYGSLLFESTWDALTGERPALVPAQLPGHFVWSVPDQKAPGMKPRPGHVAEGALAFGVSPFALNVIELWEGHEYRKARMLANGPERVEATTYLWNGRTLAAPWNRNRFDAESLDHYITEVIPDFLEAHAKQVHALRREFGLD